MATNNIAERDVVVVSRGEDNNVGQARLPYTQPSYGYILWETNNAGTPAYQNDTPPAGTTPRLNRG